MSLRNVNQKNQDVMCYMTNPKIWTKKNSFKENKIEYLIKVEIGQDLIPMYKDNIESDFGQSKEKLQDIVPKMIREFNERWGTNIPCINFSDNVSIMPPNKYEIKIKGKTVAQGILEKNEPITTITDHLYATLEENVWEFDAKNK